MKEVKFWYNSVNGPSKIVYADGTIEEFDLKDPERAKLFETLKASMPQPAPNRTWSLRK